MIYIGIRQTNEVNRNIEIKTSKKILAGSARFGLIFFYAVGAPGSIIVLNPACFNRYLFALVEEWNAMNGLHQDGTVFT